MTFIFPELPVSVICVFVGIIILQHRSNLFYLKKQDRAAMTLAKNEVDQLNAKIDELEKKINTMSLKMGFKP